MIQHILTNETYTGIWHFGKTKMTGDGRDTRRKVTSKRGFGKQVSRPRDEWIAVTVPAIIDRETFDRVQERLKVNKEHSKRCVRYKYLLGRRLTCAKCGYTYVGLTRRGRDQYYRCNDAHQKPVVCDMPYFRGDVLDKVIWDWVRTTMQDPKNLVASLRAGQTESEQENQALRQRLSLIESQLREKDGELKRLLDLYLSGAFPKEMLIERKEHLEKIVADLEHERSDVVSHIQSVLVMDKEIAEIEAWCAEIREGLDAATFEDKQRYFTLLDVRGKLAVENNEKVVYITCKLGKQRLWQMRTSPLSNTGAIGMRCGECH